MVRQFMCRVIATALIIFGTGAVATRSYNYFAPGSWMTEADYPSKAQREGWSGTTSYRLDLGTDGRATKCTITKSSGHMELDAEACRVIPLRARFKPVSDAQGKPITSTYEGRQIWPPPPWEGQTVK